MANVEKDFAKGKPIWRDLLDKGCRSWLSVTRDHGNRRWHLFDERGSITYLTFNIGNGNTALARWMGEGSSMFG